MTLTIGTRIHYTGDMANVDDKGTIVDVLPQGQYTPLSYRIKFDVGRTRDIPDYCFSKDPGCRFHVLAEWEADQKARMDAMLERCRAMQAKACAIHVG